MPNNLLFHSIIRSRDIKGKGDLTTNYPAHIQGDQLNMVFSCAMKKINSSVYVTAHVYTGQVTFLKVHEKHGHD